MLGHFFCNPVLPAQDGARARAFYRDVLGLDLASGPTDDPMFFKAGGGSALVVTEIPDRRPANYAVVSFLVTDIEGVVETLSRRGARFLEPTSSTFADVEGSVVGFITDYGPVKSSIFADSEGNLLALNEIMSN